jgi:hypothetical protein
MLYEGPHGVQYPSRSDTGDDSSDNDTSDSGGSVSTTSFDTGSQALGTTSLGTSVGSDDSGGSDDSEGSGGGGDGGVVVEDTSDPDDSSPAGGAGQTTATSRFTGIDEDTVSEMSEEEQLATTQSASDALNDLVSNTDLSPTETQNVPTARKNLDDQGEPNQSSPFQGGLSTMVQTDEINGMSTGTVVVAGVVLAVLLFGGG